MKKIWCVFALLFLCIRFVNLNKGYYNTPLEKLHNHTLVSICLSDLNSRDSINHTTHSEILTQLFIKTIYTEFVDNELRSFVAVNRILSKPFVNVWLVTKFVVWLLPKVVSVIIEVKSGFKFVVKFTTFVTLHILLFYVFTHLRTFRLAPMVLRC